MHWKLFANLAETAGHKEVTLDGEPPTFGEALDALFEVHPELEPEVLDEHGEIRAHIRALVDGEDPFAEGDGYEEPIDADAELALFPPVSGG